jgi:hypothetical protein
MNNRFKGFSKPQKNEKPANKHDKKTESLKKEIRKDLNKKASLEQKISQYPDIITDSEIMSADMGMDCIMTYLEYSLYNPKFDDRIDFKKRYEVMNVFSQVFELIKNQDLFVSIYPIVMDLQSALEYINQNIEANTKLVQNQWSTTTENVLYTHIITLTNQTQFTNDLETLLQIAYPYFTNLDYISNSNIANDISLIKNAGDYLLAIINIINRLSIYLEINPKLKEQVSILYPDLSSLISSNDKQDIVNLSNLVDTQIMLNDVIKYAFNYFAVYGYNNEELNARNSNMFKELSSEAIEEKIASNANVLVQSMAEFNSTGEEDYLLIQAQKYIQALIASKQLNELPNKEFEEAYISLCSLQKGQIAIVNEDGEVLNALKKCFANAMLELFQKNRINPNERLIPEEVKAIISNTIRSNSEDSTSINLLSQYHKDIYYYYMNQILITGTSKWNQYYINNDLQCSDLHFDSSIKTLKQYIQQIITSYSSNNRFNLLLKKETNTNTELADNVKNQDKNQNNDILNDLSTQLLSFSRQEIYKIYQLCQEDNYTEITNWLKENISKNVNQNNIVLNNELVTIMKNIISSALFKIIILETTDTSKYAHLLESGSEYISEEILNTNGKSKALYNEINTLIQNINTATTSFTLSQDLLAIITTLENNILFLPILIKMYGDQNDYCSTDLRIFKQILHKTYQKVATAQQNTKESSLLSKQLQEFLQQGKYDKFIFSTESIASINQAIKKDGNKQTTARKILKILESFSEFDHLESILASKQTLNNPKSKALLYDIHTLGRKAGSFDSDHYYVDIGSGTRLVLKESNNQFIIVDFLNPHDLKGYMS